LGTLALSAVLLYVASRSDLLPASDDVLYLHTAKALASGDGYRHSGITGQPPQAHYPIVYPALLALIWLVWPAYPDNLGLMRLLSEMASGLGILVAYAYFVRSGLTTRGLALLAVAMTAFHPYRVIQATIVYSEMVYTLLSFAALYAVARWDEESKGIWDLRRAVWAAASLAGVALAPLTRYLGAALVAGVVFHFALRRAWGKSAATLIVSAAVFAPWWLWVTLSGGSPYLTRFATGTAPLKMATSLADVLVYAVPNQILYLLPYSANSRIEQAAGGPGLTVLMGFRLAVLALVLVGFVRTWRERPQPVHGYLLVYLLIIAMFDVYSSYRDGLHRYVIPVAPLLVIWFFCGLRGLAASAERLYPTRSLAKWAVVAVAAVSLLGSAGRDSLMLYNAVTTGNVYGAQDARKEQICRDAVAWVRTQIPETARVASDEADYLHMLTGRTITLVRPPAGPARLERVLEVIRPERIDYLVAFFLHDLAAAVRAHPETLELVMKNDCAAVYRPSLKPENRQG
jgi:hypothetical protein